MNVMFDLIFCNLQLDIVIQEEDISMVMPYKCMKGVARIKNQHLFTVHHV